MSILPAVLIALHALAGIFWAGTTFVLARSGGRNAETLMRPQMGAAGFAILTGAALWGVLHLGPARGPTAVLAAGALAALLAAVVQGFAQASVRRLTSTEPGVAEASRKRIATAQRIAAVLLALTIIAMVSFRYF